MLWVMNKTFSCVLCKNEEKYNNKLHTKVQDHILQQSHTYETERNE